MLSLGSCLFAIRCFQLTAQCQILDNFLMMLRLFVMFCLFCFLKRPQFSQMGKLALQDL